MKNKIPLLLIGGTLIITVALIGYGSISSQYEISEYNLKLSGAYGIEIPFNQIQLVELRYEPIKIASKKMGFNGGEIRKGEFLVDNLGLCDLLLENEIPPFIFIEYDNGKHFILNYSDSTKTLTAFNEIRAKWNEKTVYN